MIKVYFVRHAQPDHSWSEDRTRPLTNEGKHDAKKVLEFVRDKDIRRFYCSPYKRSMDTIADAAEFYKKEIIIDERFRERISGPNGNNGEMFQKRWADLDFHEEGGESIRIVQKRNIEALFDILNKYKGQSENEKDISIVIGTHGTALSSILNFFDPNFNCNSFLRIIDWMPYIIELDFEDTKLVNQVEHLYIKKEYRGKGNNKEYRGIGNVQKKPNDGDICGKIVTVTVDRPLGSYHSAHKDMYYPINYGYIEGIMAPDGEEQDAYILGVNEPVEKFTGKVIAVIHRFDDVEEKWVVCPEDWDYTVNEISELVNFQEQYFDTEIRKGSKYNE